MPKLPVRVSIDPGSTGTGLAFWDDESWGMVVPPVAVKNIYPNKSDEWPRTSFTIVTKFEEELVNRNVIQAYCEFPEFWNNAGGQMTAGKGDLQKLTFVVGVLAQSCWSRGIPFTMFDVTEWKGQLPKSVVERRIKSRLGYMRDLHPTSHSWDAIGIGLHAKGQFRK